MSKQSTPLLINQERMKKLLAIFFCIGAALSSSAQRDIDTSLTQSAEFTGNLRLFLRDANKLSTQPLVKEQVSEMTSIRYTTLPTRKVALIDPKLIPAAKINVDEKLAKLYRGYAKAGYGSYFTPLVDIYYTDGRSKKGTFGAHYQHLSSAGGVTPDDNDSIPDHFSDNKAEIWGKYFLKKSAIQGGLSWERNVSHWFGFNQVQFNDSLPKLSMDSLRQRLNTYGGFVSYESHNRDSADLNYAFDLGLRNTADTYEGNETFVDFSARGSKLINTELSSAEFGVNYNSFNFIGPNVLATGIIFDAQDSVIQARNQDNAIIRLVPTAQTVWRGLRAKLGMGLYIEARGENPGHFYPLAEVSYNMFKGLVVPYAGLRGSTEPTTYLDLYRENPFIVNNPTLRNRNNKLELYAGIGGAFSKTVSYSAGVNSFSWANFAYFVNDSLTSVGHRHLVIYDNLKALNIHGELAIYSGEKWKTNARVDYFRYTTDAQAHAWHQPGLKVTASGQYNMRNKILVGADLFYVGERWAKSNVFVDGVEPENDGSYHFKLKGFVDLNLKVEYRYNKRLSAWVQLNNAFAQRYQRWSGYNTQRLLALMGVTYAF
jgi:hypothetical protein